MPAVPLLACGTSLMPYMHMIDYPDIAPPASQLHMTATVSCPLSVQPQRRSLFQYRERLWGTCLTKKPEIFAVASKPKCILRGLEKSSAILADRRSVRHRMADYESKTLPAENRSFAAKVSEDLCGHMGLSTEEEGHVGLHAPSGQCSNSSILCCKTNLSYSATQAMAHLGTAICV